MVHEDPEKIRQELAEVTEELVERVKPSNLVKGAIPVVKQAALDTLATVKERKLPTDPHRASNVKKFSLTAGVSLLVLAALVKSKTGK